MLLQIIGTDEANKGLTEAMQVKMDVMQLALSGGVIMIPIALLFVITLYLIIDRWLNLGKAGKTDALFMANVKDMVANGNIAGAKNLCIRTGTPVSRMIEKGISRIGKPIKNIEVSIENTGKLEVYKLEKGMATLATIAGAAPILGFIGTIIGLANSFFAVSNTEGSITLQTMAGGVYQALAATIAGLLVGLIAYIAYNLLTAGIARVINKMEISAVEFLDLLQAPA